MLQITEGTLKQERSKRRWQNYTKEWTSLNLQLATPVQYGPNPKKKRTTAKWQTHISARWPSWSTWLRVHSWWWWHHFQYINICYHYTVSIYHKRKSATRFIFTHEEPSSISRLVVTICLHLPQFSAVFFISLYLYSS